ncbi:hypothetical protein BC831DRAFT_504477 [Entophlyctis helioformis]|nr:hypothetical protein BC831DRAFT_504477 [Entophlyctis helioformis]
MRPPLGPARPGVNDLRPPLPSSQPHRQRLHDLSDSSAKRVRKDMNGAGLASAGPEPSSSTASAAYASASASAASSPSSSTAHAPISSSSSSSMPSSSAFRAPLPKEYGPVLDALQKLSDAKDLDRQTADASKALLLKYLASPGRIHDASKITMFQWSVMAIWIAKNYVTTGARFTISELLQQLVRLCPECHAREFYTGSGLRSFLGELDHFARVVRTEFSDERFGHMTSCIQTTASMHDRNASLFVGFSEIIKVFVAPTDLSLDQREVSYGVHLEAYAWFLLMYIREVFPGHRDQPAAEFDVPLSLLVILFIASQMPAKFCRSLEEIIATIFSHDAASIPQSRTRWLNGFIMVKQALCRMRDVREETLDTLLVPFQHALQTCKLNGCLKSDSDDAMSSMLPWRLYVNSLDVDVGGLLMSNRETTLRLLMRIGQDRQLEIMPDIYLRAASGPESSVAKPLRFTRTPRMSQSMSRSTARNLTSTFSRKSAMSHTMHATPLTARSASLMSTSNGDDFKSMQEHLAKLKYESTFQNLACLSLDPDVRQSAENRAANVCTAFKTRYKDYSPQWDMAIKLYVSLAVQLLQWSEHRDPAIQRELAGDSQFHRVLLTIAFEITRVAFNVPMDWTEILSLLDVHYVDLILTLDSVRSRLQLSPTLSKKLALIEERIMECELWTAPEFRAWMTYMAPHQDENTRTAPKCSPLSLWYGSVVSDAHMTSLMRSMPNSGNLPPLPDLPVSIKAMLCKVFQLVYTRLEHLAKEMSLPPLLAEKTWSIMELCIRHEHQLQFLPNRHIDLIMVSSLAMASRLMDCFKPFKAILAAYIKQPQYLEATLIQVYLGEGVPRGDVIKFYNIFFMPLVKPMLHMLPSEPPVLPLPQSKDNSALARSTSAPAPAPAPAASAVGGSGGGSILIKQATHNLMHRNLQQQQQQQHAAHLSPVKPSDRQQAIDYSQQQQQQQQQNHLSSIFAMHQPPTSPAPGSLFNRAQPAVPRPQHSGLQRSQTLSQPLAELQLQDSFHASPLSTALQDSPVHEQVPQPQPQPQHHQQHQFQSSPRQHTSPTPANACGSSPVDALATPLRLPFMTPATRKLYSHGETPLRASSTSPTGVHSATRKRLDLQRPGRQADGIENP